MLLDQTGSGGNKEKTDLGKLFEALGCGKKPPKDPTVEPSRRELPYEPEPGPPIKSSRGYPETRDPAADKPCGVLRDSLDAGSLHKLRQHYGPALNFSK